MKRLKETRDNWKANKHQHCQSTWKEKPKKCSVGHLFLAKKKVEHNNVPLYHNNYTVYRKPCSVAFAT